MPRPTRTFTRAEIEALLGDAFVERLRGIPDDSAHLLRAVRALFGLAIDIAAAGEMPESVFLAQFRRALTKRPKLKKQRTGQVLFLMRMAQA